MTDILIIGSADFVGSNLSNYFVQHTKYNLVGLDNLSTVSDLENLQASINSKSRYEFYLTDALNHHLSKKIIDLHKPKIIIYNLFDSKFSSDFDCDLVLNEVRLWLNLAEDFGCQKFIILGGSTMLYDKLSSNQIDLISSINHSCLDSSIDSYFLSYCNLFGPRQKFKYKIPDIISHIVSDKVMLDLQHKYVDFMYIKDLYLNVLNFIANNVRSGSYQLRSEYKTSYNDIYDYLSNINSGTLKQLKIISAQNELVNDETNNFYYTPNYPIDVALEHTLCWYAANKWFWKQHD